MCQVLAGPLDEIGSTSAVSELVYLFFNCGLRCSKGFLQLWQAGAPL